MNLRLFGAGAGALAMLLFVLPPASAQTCQRLDRSRGAIATVPCIQADEGRAVQRDRRQFGGSLHGLVSAAATAAGVPTAIAHAIVAVESGYRPSLRGAAGEWGLGQIKCQTARSVGLVGPCSALADPAVNLRYSMAYLASALRKGGTGCAGVSLYQRGIFGRPSCSGYGRKVMARAAL